MFYGYFMEGIGEALSAFVGKYGSYIYALSMIFLSCASIFLFHFLEKIIKQMMWAMNVTTHDTGYER